MVKIGGAVGEVLISLRRLLHARRLVVFRSLYQLRLVQHTAAIFIYAKKRHSERSHVLRGRPTVAVTANTT